MDSHITVKGIGRVSASPDMIVVGIILKERTHRYENTMERAECELGELQDAVEKAGLEKTDLKTSSFKIDADYYYERNNSTKRFAGYVCTQQLKLELDMDMKKLSYVLAMVGKCDNARPEIGIHFSVKDQNALGKKLLKNAAMDAREKAEILCEASGAQLGNIQYIDYSWKELDILSPTRFDLMEEKEMCMMSPDIDITPEDIDVTDSVEFVWEIK